MQTIEVKYGQSLFDIALEETGSVLRVVELALINGLSMTAVLQPGQVLELPPNPRRGNSGAGAPPDVQYIADDLYLWYVRQMGGGETNGGTGPDLADVVKYTPQDSTEVQQETARGNLGIEDGEVPNWSQLFLESLEF